MTVSRNRPAPAALLAIIVLALACLTWAGGALADGVQEPAGLNLTPAEKAWLAEHPVVRVGGPKAFPPFHFYDQKGKPQGIGPDHVRLIFKRLGLKADYASDLPWPQVLEKARRRELDLIACVAKSEARLEYLEYSDPYLSYPMVIITRKDAPFVGGFRDLHGCDIALVRNVATFDWLKRDGLDFTTRIAEQPLEALNLVSSGQAFAYIDNLAAASYLIQKNGLSNLKVAAPADWGDYHLYFAARKDWPQLVTLMGKALATLDRRELAAINNRWITVRYDYGLTSGALLRWAALILIPALLLVALFVLHNRSLRREVAEREKTERELSQTVEKLSTALADVRRLSGLLPICASCKKIRDDQGYWQQLEEFISEHSEAEFSHGICPECAQKLYPQLARRPDDPAKTRN